MHFGNFRRRRERLMTLSLTDRALQVFVLAIRAAFRDSTRLRVTKGAHSREASVLLVSG